jgi:hypothetical protein
MTTAFRTIITPAAHRDSAIALAAGEADFSAPLTTGPTGNPPATHYASSGLIDADVAALFDADARFDSSGEPWRDACTRLGLVRLME